MWRVAWEGEPMKRVLAVLLLLMVLSSSSAVAREELQIEFNGRLLDFDVPPMLVNGRTVVPARAILEELGAVVSWDASSRTITAAGENITVKMAIGSTTALVNGAEVKLDVPAMIVKNRTMIPVRFISESLGADIHWVGSTRTVVITSRGGGYERFDPFTDTRIMGRSYATPEQMAAYLLKYNPNPKLPISALELARIYIEEGQAEGVRGDLAFAQSLLETGYFAFGGQVLPEQNNYAGIGATNGSPVGKGAWFATPREGVRAQIQHLKAYACTEPLNQPCVDPRFDLVQRSSAPRIELLAQALNPSGVGWAYPGYDTERYSSVEEAFAAGATYGQHIFRIYRAMLSIKVDK